MSTSVPRWQVVSTVLVAVLAVTSSALGLLRANHYPSQLLPQLYVQDLLVLVVGVPTLLVSLRYAVRGSLRGRFVWLGALAYMAYVYVSVGLQVPFNRFFLGYVALFGLSLFTLVGGVVGTDPGTTRRAMGEEVSERLYGLFLVAIAVGLAGLWLAELVPATLTGEAPLLVEQVGPAALVSHFVDLAVVAPGLAVTGGLLLRKRAWGYVLAGVELVFGALLAPTLVGSTIALVVTGTVTVPLAALVLTVLPVAAAAGLAVAYLRGMDVSGSRVLEGGQQVV
jgi:hypothetical protein